MFTKKTVKPKTAHRAKPTVVRSAPAVGVAVEAEPKDKKLAKGSRRRMPNTVKDLLGYDSMLKSGVAYLGDDTWSVTLEFTDINYEISTEQHQMEIIDRWAGLLNSFNGGERLEIGIHTRMRGVDQVVDEVSLPMRGDEYDQLRQDYNQNILDKMNTATRNADQVKTLTVTVQDSDTERAIASLNRLCMRVTAQLNAIDGCQATRLDREQRLRLIAETTRHGQQFLFDEHRFDAMRGLGKPDTKDYVAPWLVDTKNQTYLRIVAGDATRYHRTLWLSDFPPELSDQLVSEITAVKAQIDVSIHLAPYDKSEGLQIVKRRDAELDMQTLEESKQNIKSGLPADAIPQDLRDAKEQVAGLRAELQSTNQRLVNAILVIGISADTVEELDQRTADVKAAALRQSCQVESLAYMQPEGLVAVLPLGNNPLPMKRTLTTNSAAILVPFTSREVYQPGGLVYGQNRRSGNLIVADRRKGMNSNGFVLATSGGGKSFSVKWEIGALYLTRDDDIIVIDPEREYLPLCEAFHGSRIEVSAGGSQRINPLDILMDESSDDEDPIRAKTSVVVDMMGSLLGGSQGLDKVERALMDRSVMQLYRQYRETDGAIGQPTLRDLRDALEHTDEPAGHDLAIALETYATGSLSGFSGQTNVDLSNRFTVFDVSGLDGEIRTFGMMVVLDQIWNRVRRNQKMNRRTWLYVDEFHRFFGNQYSSRQFKDIYKRARKYGLGVTGITQNIEELLEDQDASLMLSNSDYLLMLNQQPTDADTLCGMLHLSDEERAYFTGVLPGQGLMKFGSAFVPFDVRIDTDTDLFRLYDTNFSGK
ncbi:VirB4-like conjugal transfer ATPase, CD1110 family [Bifidobacterium biavatii]|uniref:Type IV secretory pathway, VirB4 component n=1 Tax=Bifidobacterium biavatii DSM 23969 TaxID=1437608 RepID=A0A086ZHV2_9BIFI|nr:transfer complex protein [Bifidobacterium biavatii]KFI46102.1 type IV secretory pathway, VirB4 component [Bifidobacterium biavatii DSM 23969]